VLLLKIKIKIKKTKRLQLVGNSLEIFSTLKRFTSVEKRVLELVLATLEKRMEFGQYFAGFKSLQPKTKIVVNHS